MATALWGIPPPYTVEAGAFGLLKYELIINDHAEPRFRPFPHDNDLASRVVIDNT